LDRYQEKLQSEVIVISDTAMLSGNQPSVCYALRGLLSFEIEVKGPRVDLHSGSVFGGAVQNPVHALVQLLASMRNEKGQITVNGFYDDVLPLTVDENELMEKIGVTALAGEEGYTALERAWARPTLEVNGIQAGDPCEGVKTIIPSKALAKVSCRLVPDQDPFVIEGLIRQHIQTHTPKGVQVNVHFREHVHPYALDPSHSLIQLAAQSYEQVFGVPTSFVRAGGSIPIVHHFSSRLNRPVILIGFGSPDAHTHAPNEHISLDSFKKGILTLCHYWLSLESAVDGSTPGAKKELRV